MNKKLYFCVAILFVPSPHVAVDQQSIVTKLPISPRNGLSVFPAGVSLAESIITQDEGLLESLWEGGGILAGER